MFVNRILFIFYLNNIKEFVVIDVVFVLEYIIVIIIKIFNEKIGLFECWNR